MAKTKVVIIGGGFGGAFTAKYLHKYGRDRFDIELISERNYFVFQPLLPEVAAGTINAQDAVTPLRLLLPGIKVRLADVKQVDFSRKMVCLMQGRKRLLQEIHYDHLVIASGQVTDLSLFRGFEQHSLTMKNLSDAHQLRNQVIQCLELADVTRIPQLKKMALTFVVAGGGFSGVETIGELVEMIHRTLKYYPNIQRHEIRAVLIQLGDRILPEMAPKLGEYARGVFAKRGIEVWLNTGIESATASCVKTSDGRKLETLTVVTTIGNGPSAFIKSLGIELTRGKLPVNTLLQLQERRGVWGIGDAALVPMDDSDEPVYAPPTAQFTVREAKRLAKNIVATESGQPLQRFCYRSRGMLASLGNYRGVATMFGVSIKGFPAWIIWRAFYIGMLPGFPTRLRVALNWLFDYFMPRTIVQTAQPEKPAIYYMHYTAGDPVFDCDEVLEGFYTVVSGRFEMLVDEPGGGQRRKQFGPGDHWGERILEKECLTTGKVTALEDGVVLVFRQSGFRQFRAAFKGLDDYFAGIDEQHYSSRVCASQASSSQLPDA